MRDEEALLRANVGSEALLYEDSERLRGYVQLPPRMWHIVRNALFDSCRLALYGDSYYQLDADFLAKYPHVKGYKRDRVLTVSHETLETAKKMLSYLQVSLPALHDDGPFQMSLLDSINNFGLVLGQFIDPLWRVKSPGLFADLREKISANRAAASTQLLRREELVEGNVVDPKDHPGTPREIVRAYLTGTPFVKLFDD